MASLYLMFLISKIKKSKKWHVICVNSCTGFPLSVHDLGKKQKTHCFICLSDVLQLLVRCWDIVPYFETNRNPDLLEKRNLDHLSVCRGSLRGMLKISAEAADRYRSFQGVGRCEIIRETFTTQMRTF